MAIAPSSLSNLLYSLLPSKSPPPPPSLNLLPLSSPTSLHLPKTTSKWAPIVATLCPTPLPSYSSSSTNIRTSVGDDNDITTIVYPSLAYANTLYFKSAYNVQIIVDDKEPEEKLVGRFRRAVLRAGILQECKRRRFFETSQDKKKRKTKEAAKKNRKWRPQPRTPVQAKREAPKKKKGDDDDNWELPEGDLPY